jgi:hypothetical protein
MYALMLRAVSHFQTTTTARISGLFYWRIQMTEFVETAIRKMCRYPRCGSKLPAPVSNPREAFCARGCHDGFYRKRCLVCEQSMERKTEHQLVCGKRKCRNALQGSFDGGR